MPSVLAVVLVVVMLAAIVSRWMSRRGSAAARTPTLEAATGAIAAAGLLAHCAAMFYGEAFRTLSGDVPGLLPYADAVNTMGSVSIAAYAVPAVLLLVAARRRGSQALLALAVVLVVVGVTMYAGGALWVHLAAISLLVALLAWLVSPFSRRPALAT